MSFISRLFKGGNQQAQTQQSGSNMIDLVLGLVDTAADIGMWSLDNRNAKKAATKSYERNLASWMLQNQYNDPQNQMKRIAAAGLNPNLIYGSGATATAGSVSSAPIASVVRHNPISIMSDYLDLSQKDAMTQQIGAQTGLIKQQTSVAANQRDIQTWQTNIMDKQRELLAGQLRMQKLDEKMQSQRYDLMKLAYPAMARQLSHQSGDWYNYWQAFGEMTRALVPLSNATNNFSNAFMGYGR